MEKYWLYYTTIMNLIIRYPRFQDKVVRTCPTMWADGSKCSFADDVSNKAFLEVERLICLDFI